MDGVGIAFIYGVAPSCKDKTTRLNDIDISIKRQQYAVGQQ